MFYKCFLETLNEMDIEDSGMLTGVSLSTCGMNFVFNGQ